MPRKPHDLAEQFPEAVRARAAAGMPSKCVARRHMKAAEFMTYSAMYAVAQASREKNDDKFICKAGVYWIANSNNRSVNQEREAQRSLRKKGWIVLVQSKRIGKANWYQVITHEEYVAAHASSCPPNRYTDQLMADVTGVRKNSPVGRAPKEMPDNFSDGLLRTAARRFSSQQE